MKYKNLWYHSKNKFPTLLSTSQVLCVTLQPHTFHVTLKQKTYKFIKLFNYMSLFFSISNPCQYKVYKSCLVSWGWEFYSIYNKGPFFSLGQFPTSPANGSIQVYTGSKNLKAVTLGMASTYDASIRAASANSGRKVLQLQTERILAIFPSKFAFYIYFFSEGLLLSLVSTNAIDLPVTQSIHFYFDRSSACKQYKS